MNSTNDEYVTCESTAAITVHIRKVGNVPVSLSGFTSRPQALCTAVVAWDCQIPTAGAGCWACIKAHRVLKGLLR